MAFSTVADSVDHRSAIHRRSVYAYEYKYIFFKHNHFCLLCHCGLGPLKCFISLINENFFCFRFFFWSVFSPSSIFTFTETPHHSKFFSGIICGPPWGSFVVLGSLAVQFGDHLRSGIICGLGIICGAVQIPPDENLAGNRTER